MTGDVSESGRDQRIRIVVVDDHPSYTEGLRLLFESTDTIEVAGTSTKAEAAIELIGKELPDIVLMDIHMPEEDGIKATKTIKEMFPVVKVVMLTVSEDDQDIYEAMRAGASGYLPKEVEVDELITALAAIHQGQVVVSPQVAGKLLSGEDTENALTAFERDLLRLVAEGHDNAAIGRKLLISESTVKRNLRNVVEKLHLQNRVQAAVYAAKRGWI